MSLSPRLRQAGPIAAMFALTAAGGCVVELAEPDESTSIAGGYQPDAGLEALRVRPAEVGHFGLPMFSEPTSDSDEVTRIPALGEVVELGESDGRWSRVSYFHHRRNTEMVGWVVRDKLRRASDEPAREGHNLLLPWTPGVAVRVNVAPENPMHHRGHSRYAYDFDLSVGAPVLAAHSGRVSRVEKNGRVGGCNPAYKDYANYVAINRGDGVETLYVHLKDVRVRRGQRVSRGQVIGRVGLTGYVCGSHLHFQVQVPGPDNRSVGNGRFWDSGQPWEPRIGSRPESQNRKGSNLP